MAKLTTFLSILLIALMAAERIDFLGGAGSFTLTPFLVLAPSVVFLLFLEQFWVKGTLRIAVPVNLLSYCRIVTIFLIFFLVSVVFSTDIELSGKRGLLLCSQVYLCLTLVVLLYHSKRLDTVLVNGSYLGILVYILFSLVQLKTYMAGMRMQETDSFVNMLPYTIGNLVLRPTGMTLDPNRGGLLLVVYAFFLLMFSPPSLLRRSAIIITMALLLLTMSKTAIIAMLAMLVMMAICRRRNGPLLRLTRKRLACAFVILIVLGVGIRYIVTNTYLKEAIDFAAIIEERLSASQGSSGSEHVAAITRGVEVFSDSFRNILFGHGFGASGDLLQDILGSGKYGNFHSMYVTFLAETGVIVFAIFFLIYFLPLTGNREYAPLLISIALFNIFYQLPLEPFFWFCLTLFWLGYVNVPHESGQASMGERLT